MLICDSSKVLVRTAVIDFPKSELSMGVDHFEATSKKQQKPKDRQNLL